MSIRVAELHAVFDAVHGSEMLLDVELASELPPAFIPKDTDAFWWARARAGASIRVEGIRETDAWWFFPIPHIGSLGVFVDRKTGEIEDAGSALGNFDAAVWAYERGLLRDPSRDLVIDVVRDLRRTLAALKKILNHRAYEGAPRKLEALPATFGGCAGWRQVHALREAADAFLWRAV
jgi:hypothetical protein